MLVIPREAKTDRQKSYGDAATNSWPPAGVCRDRQDREGQGTERSERFGWAGHEAEGAESQQMTMKVRREPAKPLIPKMFVHPRSDRPVDHRYRNGAHRGGSNDQKQRSKKVSPKGLPCLLRSTLRHRRPPGDVLERS
jgi:hypothetical protein